jgi:nitronate monooxygenase
VLDRFAAGESATLRIDMEENESGEACDSLFDPAEFCGGVAPKLHRPNMLVIVASTTLATALTRKSNGRIDGFVIEGHIAGGHNAPPRGDYPTNELGEPIYGDRDVVDLAVFRKIGLPFWLAGGFGDPEKLAEALEAGAQGIQVGTAFAFCEESGIDAELKQQVLAIACAGESDVRTDAVASPTGFPFKVMQVPRTLSDEVVYNSRPRICDLGYLRRAYRKPDGTVGYRCPAEPIKDYVKKGGRLEDTVGRKCICNALFAVISLGQAGTEVGTEQALMTCGNSVNAIHRFVGTDRPTYRAADVIDYLLSGTAK